MINIKPVIYKELQKVADNVTDTYPDDWENFPVVIFLEEQNKPGDWFDDKEQKSNIRYKVDIFDKDSTSNLAVEINKILSTLFQWEKVKQASRFGKYGVQRGYKRKIEA